MVFPPLQILETATRRARSFGAASVEELASGSSPFGLPAREALTRAAGAEFLNDDWFWLPGDRRNRLSTLTRRILAVTSPLDIPTIRAGVCRSYRRRQTALIPPGRVMRVFYESHPAFVLDTQDRVTPGGRLDYRVELGKNDRIFVDVLRSSWTGVLDGASLHDGCRALGMTTSAFRSAAAYSAVLDHPAADVWCLRGTRVSPVTMAALRHAKTAERRDRE